MFWMALFLLCETVEHMAAVHKYFTLRSLDAFHSNLWSVMKQWDIELPLLSAFIFCQFSQSCIYFIQMDFRFLDAIMFTSAWWPVFVYLHVVMYDKNECKGCGNCNFCKGLVTRGSGLWMHWDYFSNQITFSEIEMWTPKEAFSQQKLIAGSIFFNLEKNKVDFFFQVKCF